jgi:hypothetical protein
MKEQFIPYELALELKKLGFNEPCFAIWSGFDENNFSVTDTVRLFSSKFSIDGTQSNTLYINPTDNRVSAPLWQQAFDWFRERGYNACIEVTDTTIHYYWSITIQDSNDREYNDVDLIDSVNNRWYSSLRFENYDNARIEAIKIIIDLYKKYLDR